MGMDEINNLKKAILNEYPRLGLDDEFSFRCHPGVPCFNECCRDVNIFLTPYDIIRLKNNLGITSDEFIDKYTLSPFDKNTKYPVLILKMQGNEKKACQFVTDKGCSVYADRPWACRMYPLGMASPKDSPESEPEFYFLLKDAICKGHDEDRKIKIRDWIKDQCIDEYNEMGEYFKEITLHKIFEEEGNKLSPQKMDMFFTACYNVDRFRSFVFESSFLDKFEIPEETLAKIKDDDVEMLKFAYQWVRFAIFGEMTMKIKSDVFEAKKRERDNGH